MPVSGADTRAEGVQVVVETVQGVCGGDVYGGSGGGTDGGGEVETDGI